MPTEIPVSPPEAQQALLEGRFEGRNAFQQLVRDALAAAVREGWREITLADASFDDWPLGERAVDASLRAWSKAGRRITLLAKNYADLQARHHRFVQWRRDWSHIIEARACPSADALEIPSGIWSPGWVMQRLDVAHCVGHAGSEPARRVALRETLGEWLGKSTPSFAATTLGL